MDLRTYERLKRQFESERDAGHKAVEADYTKKTEALEIVWASIHGNQNRTSEPSLNSSTPSDTLGHRTRTSGITKAVRQAISSLEGEFTPDDIQAQLGDMNLKRQSITDSLWRLAKDGEVEIVVVGKGRRSAVYRRIMKGTDEQSGPLTNEALKRSEGLPM